jgi:predicted Zn-dependent protease
MASTLMAGMRRARPAVILACSLSLLAPSLTPLVYAQALPALGDANSQTLSPAAERRLGDRIMRAVLRDPDVVDDPLVAEHVQLIWTTLLASARLRGDITEDLDATYAWSSFLVRDRSVNAFALPGGYIGIHLGLLAVTRSTEELASVLAHELSHVTQRHIARLMSQSKQTSWLSIAAMVLGALAMSRSPQGAQAIIMGGQGLAAQGQLNFSRDMEREADRIGFGVLTEAGYDAKGMAQMFELLAQASRLNDDNNFPYLRSHPLTTERIGEARSRMGSGGLDSSAPPARTLTDVRQVMDLRQALMSARSRVLMDQRSASLQTWLQPVSLPPATQPVAVLAAHYTNLVAAVALKDRARMDAALKLTQQDLQGLSPAQWREARRVLTLTEAEGLIALGRAQQALQLLQPGSASALVPDARPELILRARAALSLPEAGDHTGMWADAASRLQTLVTLYPQDATAWQLLSALWARLGQPLRALRADAEASAASGDLQGAIDRVESARRRYPQATAGDLIEMSVMDARVRTWRQTVKEDAREDLG